MTDCTEIKADGYSVCIGTGALPLLSEAVEAYRKSNRPVFVLVDDNSRRHCLPLLEEAAGGFADESVIVIPAGERHKNIETCCSVWGELGRRRADRKSLLINLGGGVVGDLGGFAASTFKRGIDFIQVPTTLLAQVDASVGGKLGVDFNNLKNEIGVFNCPRGVYIAPVFLNTLDDRQLHSGYAEILKHALIADAQYWEAVKDGLPGGERRTAIIRRSVQIKNAMVTADPKENGDRRKLNFGHTIGHAVESWSLANDRDALLHGEAVAVGMICESRLSVKYAGLREPEAASVAECIRRQFGAYPLQPSSYDRLLDLIAHDKKSAGGSTGFSLLAAVGKCVTGVTCSRNHIVEALDYYRNITGA